ncbi:MAG: peptidase [Anaerolineae bacterium]|nr:MAG: serine protease [Chlorobiota bacterium]MBE7468861.1 serine protease [Anaerolineales bacterium]MCQ3973253.1 serine protease [Anaerolineae bacterium]
MTRTTRMELIEKIQAKRNSRLVVYITGDRRGLETKIATDVFPMLHRHLVQIKSHDKIDLFLYSTGGITIAGFALVNLFREFCNEFNVIVPFKALSCATLITLGANEIVMTKMGQLSPIDPSIEHPLGPVVEIPGQPGRIVPVNVEDINAFFDLARNEADLKGEESIRSVFEILASKVNPIVLGAVQRSRQQIAFLAARLMTYHTHEEEHINKTVDILTRQRFSHDYIISRREAKDVLKLNIIEPDEELTTLIVDLFRAYNEVLKIDQPYNPETVLGLDNEKVSDFNRAIIESIDLTHIFRTTKEIKRAQIAHPGIPQVIVGYQERILKEEWTQDESI